MKNNHAFFNRIDARAWLIAVALGCLSLSSHAAGFGQFMAVVTGKSTAVKVASNGTVLATKAPTALTPGNGWQAAGNYGVAQGAAGAVQVGAEATVGVAGKAVPVSIVGQVTKDAVIGGITGCATGGVIGCVIGVGTPLAIAYLTSSGVRMNPDGSADIFAPPECGLDCYYWAIAVVVGQSQPLGTWPYSTPDAACLAAGSKATVINPRYKPPYTWSASSGFCQAMLDGTTLTSFASLQRGPARAPDSGTWHPATPVEVKEALYKKDPSPLIVPELDKAGAGPDVLPITGVTTTGPLTIVGPSTTTINNIDNSVTTSQTTNDYTYNGDTVTSGGSRTETQTTKPDGTKTDDKTETFNPGDQASAPPEDPKVQCDKYPNSLGCAELDTPSGDIPKDTKTVAFQEESVFGGGGCPANKTMSLHGIGSVTVWDFEKTCAYIAQIRAMVVALAMFAALLIVTPGKEVRT
jgi:hypothetical protein